MSWPPKTASTTQRRHPSLLDMGPCWSATTRCVCVPGCVSLGTSPISEPAHKLQPTCPDPSQVIMARPNYDLLLMSLPAQKACLGQLTPRGWYACGRHRLSMISPESSGHNDLCSPRPQTSLTGQHVEVKPSRAAARDTCYLLYTSNQNGKCALHSIEFQKALLSTVTRSPDG